METQTPCRGLAYATEVDPYLVLDNILKLHLIVIGDHARARGFLFGTLVEVQVGTRGQLFLGFSVAHCVRVVTFLGLGLKLPGHGKITRLNQMRDHFQGLFQIGFRLAESRLKVLERPVSEFAETLVDQVQQLVLRHTRRLVLLGFELGALCRLLWSILVGPV